MVKLKKISVLICTGTLLLAACTGSQGESVAALPTDTLAPLFSLTPRLTATPFASRTPLPTFTPIPSDTPIPPTPSDTPTPTEVPPVIGIIQSMDTVNVREGPGVSFSAIRALNPGTGVEVLGQNADGSWLNVKLEDGTEGWVSSRLLFLQATPTPIPTFTATPDLTALALGTPLPTALIGGGTITPTPPRSAVTATPPGTPSEVDTSVESTVETSPTEVFLPIIDVDAINLTATALAGGVVRASPPPPAETGQSPNNPVTLTPGETASAQVTQTPASTAAPGSVSVQQGADVFAMCDNPTFRTPPPGNLAAGSTIDVFWAWYVADPSYMQQHLDAVTYEVRLNDTLLANWQEFGSRTVQVGDSYAKYWYVPISTPLSAGQYRITYRATWSRRISDGYEEFGPGTRNEVEEGSCTFTVR